MANKKKNHEEIIERFKMFMAEGWSPQLSARKAKAPYGNSGAGLRYIEAHEDVGDLVIEYYRKHYNHKPWLLMRMEKSYAD